ncbi:hypothetical protein [Mucilaginibacter sp.]
MNTNDVSVFTNTQKERFNSIFPIIGNVAADVINNLKGRGRNSWKIVLSNILLVNNPKTGIERNYNAKLDQEIDLDETYSTNQFTQIVSKVRFKVGLPAFESKIEQQCEHELFKFFLWEDVYSVPEHEGEKPVFIGYKPVCRLKV